MLARESERLKKFKPFNMPCTQLVLTIDVRQSLVIRIDYKRLQLDVMIPMLQSPNNDIELFIIGRVVES